MILDETFTLPNGVDIPKLGLGTWLVRDKDVAPAVAQALDLGYRHIDTARAYRNEAGVARGIRDSGVSRDDVFVTTKLSAGAKSYRRAASGIDRSLSRLGLDHIDLMLIHAPQPWRGFRGDRRYFDENREVWRALEDAYHAGKVRAIGLSNFGQDDVENLLDSSTVRAMVNQILAHLSNTPSRLIEFCQREGLLVEAYSPVAHGELLKNGTVAAMAQRYGVSIPQLSIRYDLQLGLLPLPKTTNPAHMRDNADVDFVISDADMAQLRGIEPIADYGDASVMPVYGGQMNLRGLVSMIRQSARG